MLTKTDVDTAPDFSLFQLQKFQ